jgi:hypothetical protein
MVLPDIGQGGTSASGIRAGSDLGPTRTYVRKGSGPELTAMIQVRLDADGALAGVEWVGAVDMHDLKMLSDEMIANGDLSIETFLEFASGGVPFRQWLQEQGVITAGMDEADFWKWFDENPDGLQRFYSEGGWDRTPQGTPYQTWKPGVNPSAEGTERTLMGAEFQRQTILQEVAPGSREWPQSIEHFHVTKPADPRIIELIGTGGVTDSTGAKIFDWDMSRATTNKQIRKQFAARKAWFRDDIDHWRANSPDYMSRPTTGPDAQKIGRIDEGVNLMFQMLMSKPTDFLSRSPAFRQFYWQRAGEMASFLDEADRARLLTSAEKARVLDGKDLASKAGGLLRRIRRQMGRENVVDEAMRYINDLAKSPQRVETGSIRTLEQLDEMAKAYAVAETKALLYDLSQRHNFTDSMRLIAPFGEAWFELISTWATLVKENPRIIRRMQQSISGARGSNPFADVEADGEQGRGFFFDDPSSGEEIFAYPGLGLIPDWMPFIGGAGEVSDNLELTGRVSGLNMMGQIMPGIGPVLQIPLSQFSYFNDVDNPNRFLRDLVMPFGVAEFDITNPETWLSTILPRWVNKGLAAWGQGGENNQRLYESTAIDVYKTLLMQGWSDDSPEEMQKTMEHAYKLAGDISRLRALATFAAPAGTSNLWEVSYDPKDQEGDVWAYTNLATAYRQIRDELGGDEVRAFKQFTDIFGLDPMLFTVAKTERVLPRAVTLESRKWEQDNGDLFQTENYSLTAHFAHPDAEEGEFDYETYLQQLTDDSRQGLTLEQWGLKRNQFVGRVAYSNFQRQADLRFDDAEQKTLWLRNAHSSLQVLFPGYGNPIAGTPTKPSLDQQIEELYRWENDIRLSDSEPGQALLKYLTLRDQIIRLTQTRLGYTSDVGFRSGKLAALYRRQLRATGASLIEQYPEFLALWQQILARELEEPESTNAPVNLAGVRF